MPMLRRLTIIASLALLSACSATSGGKQTELYTNPVIDRDAPDPTVIRAEDGTFYAYATWRDRNIPVYQSTDMVNWEYEGGVFAEGEVPQFVPGAAIWAPDINYIEGQYVLYFSMSVWGGEWDACIG
ncbi:MAG: family 43 glycosylhydrolase, partial [Alistipes sp.]|nr:family 43 glycosylhydrolase [Alistipes sp.]